MVENFAIPTNERSAVWRDMAKVDTQRELGPFAEEVDFPGGIRFSAISQAPY